MATTGVGFRWLDILEKEFDKACVELDTSLLELAAEDGDIMFGARQKIATLSSCFAQLTHKALTIFQHSAKLEELGCLELSHIFEPSQPHLQAATLLVNRRGSGAWLLFVWFLVFGYRPV